MAGKRVRQPSCFPSLKGSWWVGVPRRRCWRAARAGRPLYRAVGSCSWPGSRSSTPCTRPGNGYVFPSASLHGSRAGGKACQGVPPRGRPRWRPRRAGGLQNGPASGRARRRTRGLVLSLRPWALRPPLGPSNVYGHCARRRSGSRHCVREVTGIVPLWIRVNATRSGAGVEPAF